MNRRGPVNRTFGCVGLMGLKLWIRICSRLCSLAWLLCGRILWTEGSGRRISVRISGLGSAGLLFFCQLRSRMHSHGPTTHTRLMDRISLEADAKTQYKTQSTKQRTTVLKISMHVYIQYAITQV